MDLKRFIRDIQDFPKPGIVFKDITPLLGDSKAFAHMIKEFANRYREMNISKICGIEARGFIIGSALALELGIGFVPLRKAGKLPYKTRKKEYSLEYGVDAVEIHEDAVERDEKIILIDDLIATGGTARAALDLLEELGADVVEIAFAIELSFLKGIEKFKDKKVFCLLTF
jgi:adenine phosphoribosyltransferase